LGQAASAEALGMIVATAVAGALLSPRNLRVLALLSCLSMIVANWTTHILSANGVIVIRLINGLGSGITMWILVGLLSRTKAPGRMFAYYVTGQCLLSFVLSWFMARFLIPGWGASGGYYCLLGISIVSTFLILWMPDHYSANTDSGDATLPTVRGSASLLVTTFFMAGIFSTWVYIMPLSRQAGHAATEINSAISLALALQIVGGAAATSLADRWSATMTTAGAATLGTASVLLLLYAPQTWALYLSTCLLAFVWMFSAPFSFPMIMKFDPSGRSAMFVGTAQLAGVALGPTLASATIAGQDYHGVVLASVSAFVASLGLLAFLGVSTAALTPRKKTDARTSAF
jgi:MFS transporter, DHA1 family, inner membrane transport protein